MTKTARQKMLNKQLRGGGNGGGGGGNGGGGGHYGWAGGKVGGGGGKSGGRKHSPAAFGVTGLEKQIKAASQKGETSTVLASAERLSSTTSGTNPAGGALQEMLVCLVSQGMVAEAAEFLSAHSRRFEALCRGSSSCFLVPPLDPQALCAALAAMPQAAGVTPADGVALVDASLHLMAMPLASRQPGALVSSAEAAAYLHRRFRWGTLELLEEAEQALSAVDRTPAASLARAGKCVHGCRLQPGQKPGEVLVSGGDNGGGDARRTMQPGDVVAVRRVDAGAGGAGFSGGGYAGFAGGEGGGGEYGRPSFNASSSGSSSSHYGQSQTSYGASSSAGDAAVREGSSGGSSNDGIVECEVKLAAPLVLEPKDKAKGRAFLTGAGPTALWRVDKLANCVQFERAITGARIVAIAAAAGPEANPATGERGDNSVKSSGTGKTFKGGKKGNGGKDLAQAGKEAATRWPSFDIAAALVCADRDGGDLGCGAGSPAGTPEPTATTTTSTTTSATASGGPTSKRAPGLAASPAAAGSLSSHLLHLAQAGPSALNPSQANAFVAACTRRLTLIQGPPGTGKTAVSCRILAHWARERSPDLSGGKALPMHFGGGGFSGGGGGGGGTGGIYGPASADCMTFEQQGGGGGGSKKPSEGPTVLACSDSNIAVDNLLDGLLRARVRAVRIGRPEGTRPELLPYSVDAVAGDAAKAAAASGGDPKQAAHEARSRMLKGASVLCATCVGAGSGILERCSFTRVLVDEAAQATELATVVALGRGCAQLALVGDHAQLPPTVGSDLAGAEGLSVPLFTRLVHAGVVPFLLSTQYRMHPSIAAFPSACFYGGRIDDGVPAASRPPIPGFSWPRPEFPLCFVPTSDNVREQGDGTSHSNPAEGEIVANILRAVLSAGSGGGDNGFGALRPEDIGVVTPYAAQVRLLRRLRPHPAVEVASVDGFQGREKALILFSAVRANERGACGFVADWRRANVALTRAQRGVIVVGHAPTLAREGRSWGPLLRFLDAQGAILGKAPPPLPPPPVAAENGAASGGAVWHYTDPRAQAREICGVEIGPSSSSSVSSSSVPTSSLRPPLLPPPRMPPPGFSLPVPPSSSASHLANLPPPPAPLSSSVAAAPSRPPALVGDKASNGRSIEARETGKSGDSTTRVNTASGSHPAVVAVAGGGAASSQPRKRSRSRSQDRWVDDRRRPRSPVRARHEKGEDDDIRSSARGGRHDDDRYDRYDDRHDDRYGDRRDDRYDDRRDDRYDDRYDDRHDDRYDDRYDDRWRMSGSERRSYDRSDSRSPPRGRHHRGHSRTGRGDGRDRSSSRSRDREKWRRSDSRDRGYDSRSRSDRR